MSIQCFSLGFAAGMIGRDFLGLIGDAFSKKEKPRALPVPVTPSYKSSYIPKKEDSKVFGFGEKKQLPAKVESQSQEMSVVQKAQSNSLWGFKSNLAQSALSQGKRVKTKLSSFEGGVPFMLEMDIQ